MVLTRSPPVSIILGVIAICNVVGAVPFGRRRTAVTLVHGCKRARRGIVVSRSVVVGTTLLLLARCLFGSPCGHFFLALLSALSSLGLLRCFHCGIWTHMPVRRC